MSSEREESREEDRKKFRLAGLWATMNSLKREGDNQRAALASQHGVQAANLPGFGQEIPFGNTYVSQNSTGSSLGKFTQAAVLALAAAAAGFGLQSYLSPKTEPSTPPPVNAVLEWEITPDGESGTSSRSVSVEERGVSAKASRRDDL